MTMGWFQGRRLEYNDTVTYRCAAVAPQNPAAAPQMESEGRYRGKVVDFTDAVMVGVRADGWWGEAPLYYVLTEDILSVEPYVDTERKEEERQQARLARRERDVPVPDPDSPDARRHLRTGARSSGRRSHAPRVGARCGGPPRARTCARSACRCPGSRSRAESGSPGCSHARSGDTEIGLMRERPMHGASRPSPTAI